MHVDREAIARALVNLVDNALKYSADEKFLGVKLYRANGVLKLEVIDRGIGIMRREQSKIFEKFYRTGDPLVHNTKGSGLGLSLVRHITRAHGGDVEVESTPGKGSKFTLSLPLVASNSRRRTTEHQGRRHHENQNEPHGRPNGAATDSRSETGKLVHRSDAEENAGKRICILIVEDEPAMVAGLRDNFEYEGYEVISASDGVEGLERALADDPDLVVLDVMMPRMSGLDVCKQLKAKRPSVPIIMLTARGQEIDKVVGLELGADDYVTKPFSVRELMARVKAVLRRASPQAMRRRFIGSATSRSIFGQRSATRWHTDRAVGERVRLARLLHRSSGGNAEPRPPAGCSLGVRKLSEHAHRRHTHRSLPTEAGTESRRAAFHSDRPRKWL